MIIFDWMSLVVERIDKYYGYAHKIAGDLGQDLVHFLISDKGLLEKTKNVHQKALDRYVHVSLEREYRDKSSKFYKKYVKPDVSTDQIDDTPTKGYDTIPIHRILLELEIEGHTYEVKVFKQCYFLNISELEFSRRSAVDYRVIRKMCTFVKDQIRERYEFELD
jgi:hypothetical protein